MNVYEISKDTLQKSVVKRIPDTSYEEAAAIGSKTLRHIQDGINYIQEIVATDDLWFHFDFWEIFEWLLSDLS